MTDWNDTARTFPKNQCTNNTKTFAPGNFANPDPLYFHNFLLVSSPNYTYGDYTNWFGNIEYENYNASKLFGADEAELAANETTYFPFTYMYVKDVEDSSLATSLPTSISDWLYGKDGFFNRIVEENILAN